MGENCKTCYRVYISDEFQMLMAGNKPKNLRLSLWTFRFSKSVENKIVKLISRVISDITTLLPILVV